MIVKILLGAIILAILSIFAVLFFHDSDNINSIQTEKNDLAEANCEKATYRDLCLLEKVYINPSSLPSGLTGKSQEVSKMIINKEIPVSALIEYFTDNRKKTNFRISILSSTLQSNLTLDELTQIDKALQKSLPQDNDEFQIEAPSLIVKQYRYKSFSSINLLLVFESMLLSEKNDTTASGILNAIRISSFDDTKQQEIVMNFISEYDSLVNDLPATMIWAVQLMYSLHPVETSEGLKKICSADFAKYVTTDAIMQSRYNLCKQSNNNVTKLCLIDEERAIDNDEDGRARAAKCMPTIQQVIRM